MNWLDRPPEKKRKTTVVAANLREVYESGNIQFHVYEVNQTERYWIQNGIVGMELDETDFVNLLELLLAYAEEGATDPYE